MSGIKNSFKTFLTITAPALLISIIVGEIALRVWWGDKPVTGGGAPNLVWIKRFVKENELGVRGRLPPPEKPRGIYRIVALGDSITYGKGIEHEEDRWPEALANLLSKRLGAPVETVNLGYPALNTVEERESLVEKGLKFQPDVVVVQYDYNDPESAEQRMNVIAQARGPVWRQLLTTRLYLADFLHRQLTRSKNDEIFREYIHYISSPNSPNIPAYRKAIESLKDDCAKTGAGLVFVVFPTLTGLNRTPYEYEDAEKLITGELDELGIPYVSLLPKLKDHEGRDLWASPYDAHPDEGVHMMAAEELDLTVFKILKGGL